MASGAATSRGSQIPPSASTSVTRSGVCEGVRDVAITLCPALRAMKARDSPKPEEQPVMSHTRGFAIDIVMEDVRSDLNC